MDTLAALALATEKPKPSIISAPPIKKNENIMTAVTWRQIYGMSIYITIAMSILLFFGKLIYDLDYERTTLFYDDDNNATSRTKHYTILFNTFVFMHVFNEFNCRKIGAKSYNIFSGLFSNWMFLAVIIAIVGIQWVFINILGRLVNCTTLTSQEFAVGIFLGLTTWIASFLLKLTPLSWLKKIPIKVDESK